MKNLGQMMKQAQEVQTKMQEMQDRLAEAELTGASGGGMVSITMTGKGEVRRVDIDPSLVVPDDKEVLEDLIAAAVNDAKQKVDAFTQEETQKIMGGLQLPPGVKLPF
ncbi:YbaB/EbfC family nucleoid-associated protein [Hwanghaeella grinnelliae]|uniref:Nucleoid-associated protein EOI86_15405 n=1 Tax=Hwanghaeella grinnelliae TaxID=2500179 RepID=A0A437QR19_9PROT|nr:YbaB/EbfC family nucleoid-associated protein [Hwanghaeella grinnelliae]RVU36958.1 YbaB/EbfC family nucleoid-associated protein [Hwanghaeella grinnelliae]